jgi:hypothetical protein
MSLPGFRESCDFVIDRLARYHVNDEGMFIGAIDAERGDPIDSNGILEDLGDTIPFLLEAGAVDLARVQVQGAIRALAQPIHQNERRTTRRWMRDGYDLTDLLLGLIEWHETGLPPAVDNVIATIFSAWKRTFSIRGWYFGKAFQSVPMPLPLATASDLGMYPEILFRWSRLTGRARYREWGVGIVDQWLSDPFFREHGLFPRALTLGVPLLNGGPFRTSRLFKDNTNLAASLLAAHREEREPRYMDAFHKWHRGVVTHLLTPEGAVQLEWSPHRAASGCDLRNFQVIDLLCEAYVDSAGGTFLETACRVADYWIARQQQTGLFPNRPLDTDFRTMGDSETDMTVALFKLFELTAKPAYETAALRCLEGISRYHYRACGMANAVDARDGRVIDATSKTKFLALSVKAWLARDRCGRIFSSPAVRERLADR